MRSLSILTAAALTFAAAAASAQPAPPMAGGDAVVTVALGPELLKKQHDFGARELADLSNELRKEVQSSLAHAHGVPPVQVSLVIEDAVPNRPTFDQLGRTIGLSMRSVGLGGARVSGVVTYADGASRPVRVQYYETDLHNERGVATWSDAYIAFDRVASDISRGAIPARYQGPGPAGSGHFGYPFNNQ
jgi:hypothetical protein